VCAFVCVRVCACVYPIFYLAGWAQAIKRKEPKCALLVLLLPATAMDDGAIRLVATITSSSLTVQRTFLKLVSSTEAGVGAIGAGRAGGGAGPAATSAGAESCGKLLSKFNLLPLVLAAVLPLVATSEAGATGASSTTAATGAVAPDIHSSHHS
jgi:hypothetical protein